MNKTPDKKQYKKLTKDNIYKPKKLSLRNFNRFISPFIDRYNWGSINAEGEKSFHFSQYWIYQVPYKSYIKLREKPRIGKFRDISLQDHLQARQHPDSFVFYTSNPYSDLCLLCGDIDPIEGYGYEECLQALHYIRDTFHPKTYWERSTTGRGIHFYIIIDFSSFTPHCGNNYDVFHRQNCNDIIEKYSQLLSSLIDSMYYCKFDKFCGTYPVYSYPISSHVFINRGDMGKLPCPQDTGDISVLYNTPILSYSDLGKNWERMQELMNNSDNCDETNESVEAASSLILPYNILGTPFDKICKKNDEYMNDNSAFTRTRHSIQKLARELGRIPLYEEWNRYYELNECNTGEETEDRKKRYAAVAPYVEKGFDISLTGQIYRYGDFIDNLRNDITEEKIKLISIQAGYSKIVTYGDLDVGLGAHWMANRTNLKYGNELCVPRDTIPSLFKKLKEMHVINRSCNNNKARAIREILIHLKYIKLIDPYYSWKKEEQISQKWGMNVNFPKYNDYQLFCGDAEKMALQIKKYRDEGKIEFTRRRNFLPKVYQDMLGDKM